MTRITMRAERESRPEVGSSRNSTEGFAAISTPDVGFRIQGAGFRVPGSGFRVQGSGSKLLPSPPLCRDTSLIRNSAPLGPYGRTMPGALWWP